MHLGFQLVEVLLCCQLLLGLSDGLEGDLASQRLFFNATSDRLAHGFGRDVVLLVVGDLLLSPPLVSSIARCIEGVTLSAYKMTLELTLRAARPMVWIRDVSLRRNPSLSASRIATRETSGKSSPLAQEIDSDQDVELSLAQRPKDLDTLDRVQL